MNLSEKFLSIFRIKRRKPIPGEIWILGKKSPWPENDITVKIVDVKDGHVKYVFNVKYDISFCSDIKLSTQDQVLTMSVFLSCYNFYEDGGCYGRRN